MFQIIGLLILGIIQSALVFVSSYYIGDFVAWLAYGDDNPYVQGNAKPTPGAVQTESSQLSSSEQGYTVSFVSAPATARSGQTVTVQWQVTGPAGRQGTNAILLISTQSTADTFNGTGTVSERQSFGRFTIPATFSKTITVSGNADTRVNIEATALIEGLVLGARHTIQITP